MSILVGIAGVARSGKDSMAEMLKIERGGKIIHLADAIKTDLDDLLLKRIGHSAFTEDTKIKELIRPLLVCYGTQVVRHFNDSCWLDLTMQYVDENPDKNIFIPDVRFGNEVEAIQRRGGQIIHVSRFYWDTYRNPVGEEIPFKVYKEAPNEDERTNDPIIKDMANIKFEWEDFKDRPSPQINFAFRSRNDYRP